VTTAESTSRVSARSRTSASVAAAAITARSPSPSTWPSPQRCTPPGHAQQRGHDDGQRPPPRRARTGVLDGVLGQSVGEALLEAFKVTLAITILPPPSLGPPDAAPGSFARGHARPAAAGESAAASCSTGAGDKGRRPTAVIRVVQAAAPSPLRRCGQPRSPRPDSPDSGADTDDRHVRGRSWRTLRQKPSYRNSPRLVLLMAKPYGRGPQNIWPGEGSGRNDFGAFVFLKNASGSVVSRCLPNERWSVARSLDRRRTLWIPRETPFPPKGLRPGAMGGGRHHSNTTGSLAFPASTAFLTARRRPPPKEGQPRRRRAR
jgi:hypothetical protein